MSRRAGALASLSLVLCWGCGPPSMVPVAPPGLEFQAVTPEKSEEEPAEAIGENRTALSTASPSTALVKSDSPEKGAGAAGTPSPALAEPTQPGETKTTASGLKYETVKPGTGATAQPGRTAVVHYTGTLTDGTKFDSSRDPGKRPYPVPLGRGTVIQGWEEGLAGMKVGEVRKLIVPPNLGYADRPPPGAPIPPGATLLFEVELMDVK